MQLHAGLGAGRHHLPAIVQAGGERLFAKDVDARSGSGQHKRRVLVGRTAHNYRAQAWLGQQVRRTGTEGRNGPLPGKGAAQSLVGIVHADDLNADHGPEGAGIRSRVHNVADTQKPNT
jgi:hypothetical protein